MITLTRRSTRRRYAGRGTWRTRERRYEGTEGNRQHITLVEEGTIPTASVARIEGVMGEVRHAHRKRHGAEWEAFVDDIRHHGIREPIFITVDPGEPPKLSEGNHRLDAALEAGLPEVPVEIRYYGHAERAGTVLERGEMRTRSSGRDLTRLAHERAGGYIRGTLVHGWLLPDGMVIHGTHPGIRDTMGADYDELWDAGWARVMISNWRVGVETERPLTAAQQATITEYADRSPLPMLIEVRDSNHHLVWGDEVSRTVSIERLLREVNQHAVAAA